MTVIDRETLDEIEAGLYWCDLHWCGPEFPDWHADTDGRVYRDGLDVTPRRDQRGYFQVSIAGRSVKRAHLVCAAFHGPRPRPKNTPRGWRGLGVAHWNDIKHDDRPENLRWATIKENIADAQRNRRRSRAATPAETQARVVELRTRLGLGGECFPAYMTDERLAQARQMRDDGERLAVVARVFGFTMGHFSRLVGGWPRDQKAEVERLRQTEAAKADGA